MSIFDRCQQAVKTIWRFRERFGREGIEAFFTAFDGCLRECGQLLRAGKVIRHLLRGRAWAAGRVLSN